MAESQDLKVEAWLSIGVWETMGTGMGVVTALVMHLTSNFR